MDQPQPTQPDPRRPAQELGDDVPEPKAPKFGCIMFSLLIAFMTGALVFALVQGGRMYKEVLSFTDEEPVELPTVRGTPEELATIRAKVDAFIKAVEPENPPLAELALDARELNMLINNDNYLTDLRGTFYIESIEPGGLIHTLVSRPRRHIVFWKPQRYQNGEIDVQVEAAESKFFLRVVDVRVKGRTIDPGILAYMRTEDLLEMYKKDERFEAVALKINSARVENGSIVVSTAMAEPAEGQ